MARKHSPTDDLQDLRAVFAPGLEVSIGAR